jgi:hypothetical protein
MSSEFTQYSDSELLTYIFNGVQQTRDIPTTDNPAMYELGKRLFIAQMSLGAIMAMHHGVDDFCEFDQDGFKDEKQLLHKYKEMIDLNARFFIDILDNDLDYREWDLSKFRTLGKDGKLIEPTDDDEDTEDS